VKGELVVATGERSRVDPERLVNLLTQAGAGIHVTPDHRILAPAPGGDAKALLDAATQLLFALGA
jgi:hypothetical protein